jgi:N-acyl-D-amino-acid deacylase
MIRLGALLCSLVISISSLADAKFDLILRNGKIIDGAGNAWFYGDVGIKGDRIAKIGALNTDAASREIDAAGLVIAPGFIDVHTHADTDLFRLPHAENFIRDGVTTIVIGNCGGSPTDIGEYFATLQKKGVALNVAALIGHNSVLRKVKGDRKGDLSPEQMIQAEAIVEKAMLDGAIGFSTGLIYTPGEWSSTEEIVELARVSAKHGGIYATHMRSEGLKIIEAIDEALRVGREAGCRVQISHFKLPRDAAARLGGADATLGKVMQARAAGQEVWLDQYPYTASSTTLSTLLPDWVLENGREEATKTLRDPEKLKKVLADMKQSHEVGRRRTNFKWAVIASCQSNPEYSGKSVYQIALMNRVKPGEEMLGSTTQPSTRPSEPTMEEQYLTIIDIYLRGGASAVFHTLDEKEVIDILKSPLVGIASDSGVREPDSGQPHPRGYGTNARVLGHYARDLHVITLEDAIRKMTSMPATAFRVKDRGLLREGYFADITVFDPEKVIDKATFESPHQYPEGIEYVIVNGKLVMENGKVGEALPGKAVYGPGLRSP